MAIHQTIFVLELSTTVAQQQLQVMELREKEKRKEDNNFLKRFATLYQKKCAGKEFLGSRYARKDNANIHI